MVIEVKRINSIRQVKKHLRSPFDRTLQMSVTTFTDTFYDGRKGIFVDRAEAYYFIGDFKSKTVNISYRRREMIADNYLEEVYKLFNFPNKVISRHG